MVMTEYGGFEQWIKNNGGDDGFIAILKEYGFTSKLSISNLQLDCQDGQDLCSKLNPGQKCLLRGLISMVQPSTPAGSGSKSGESLYSACSSRLGEVRSKRGEVKVRSKINELFNFKSSELDEFQPTPLACRKRVSSSRKGKDPVGKPPRSKRKVKEVILKVVGLPWLRSSTPTGTEREKYFKKVWAQESTSADGIRSQIMRELGWPADQDFRYMYANGRHLRVAKLSDVENSTSWDCETLRALMGNGCLYLCKVHDIDKGLMSSEVEEEEEGVENDADKLPTKVSL